MPDPKIVAAGIGGLLVLLLVFWGITGRGGPMIEFRPPSPILFRKSPSGMASTSVQISNPGKTKLEISAIETSPPAFSVETRELTVEPGGTTDLSIHFNAPSDQMVQGRLVVHSNVDDSPTTVILIANRDPWWVYKSLEESSVLFTKDL